MDKDNLVKENYGEESITNGNDFALVPKMGSYEVASMRTDPEKRNTSKLLTYIVAIVTVIALLALALAVAAVITSSLTNNTDEQILKQNEDIENLKEMLNRSEVEGRIERERFNQTINNAANTIQDLGQQISMLRTNHGELNLKQES